MSTKPPPYTTLPSEPPPAYEEEPTEYSPAPPVIQHTSENVVVMTQPGSSSQISFRLERRAADNFILTVIMMVVCGVLLDVFAFACLVPALLLSMKAREANSRGDYQEARKNGQYSMWLNLTAMITYIALMVIGIIIGLFLAIKTPS